MKRFTKVYRRRGLKVNANENKVMVLGGEVGLQYEIRVDGSRLDQVREL